jgi:hypothetical protein
MRLQTLSTWDKRKKIRMKGEIDRREVESSGKPDLLANLSVDGVCYNMFPHKEKGVLWL